jgi:hypothetical protein
LIIKIDDLYEGQWINDHRNGKGTMKYGNGDSYDGFWQDDLKRNLKYFI